MSIAIGPQDYTAILESQPGKLRALSRADFPALEPYKKEWHRFLSQRGHELERQLKVNRSEQNFAHDMQRRLDWFWQNEHNPEYDPAFLHALKKSLIGIAQYYASIQIIKPESTDEVFLAFTSKGQPVVSHQPILKADPSMRLDSSPSSEGDNKTGFSLGKSISTGITALTYSFVAAVMMDLAIHHEAPETSYTARVLSQFAQSTP